ncbi:hypothetical protein V6W75_06245 [Mannheimia sp. HC-2023]|uniref:hypothetical protein n=1 Tax=Mannheimia indoligenes TaxID=3103145 RepID=UPI002FE5CEF2
MSIDILNSKNDIFQLLLEKLQADIWSKFSSLESSFEWEIGTNFDDLNKRWFIPIYFTRKDEWNDFTISLQFDKVNFQELCFGICYEFDPDESRKKEIKEKLSKNEALLSLLPEEFKKERDGWWAYWKSFSNDLRNWNSETWAKIPSGQLADEIWQEIEPLCKAVTQLDYPKN